MLTLLYHNLLQAPANGLPVAGHQVGVDSFREHIYRLRKQLLHPLEVHEELLRGRTPRGILVSLDDGAKGIIRAGEILSAAGAMGVAFICPGALSKGVWFYRLADAVLRSSKSQLSWREHQIRLTSPAERRNAYGLLSLKLFNLCDQMRERLLDDLTRSLEVTCGEAHPALVTCDEGGLREAAQTGGLVFANHSWSHPNLTSLSNSELSNEIGAAQDWLQSSKLPTVPWFAFPRGRYDLRVRTAVKAVCPLAFGANPFDSEVLPRAGIYQLDANRFRFALKTAWEGRLRRFLTSR